MKETKHSATQLCLQYFVLFALDGFQGLFEKVWYTPRKMIV